MTTTSSFTTIRDYTWDGAANVTWDSYTAQLRTWSGASAFAHRLDVSELIRAVDAEGSTIAKRLREAVSTASGVRRGFGLRVRELLRMADVLGRAAGYSVKLAEGLTASDFSGNHFFAVEREVMSVADAARRAFAVVKRDGLSFGDDHGFWTTYNRAFSEAISATSRSGRGQGKRAIEILRIAETMTDKVSFVRQFAEAMSVSESYQDIINFSLNFAESVVVAERLGKSPRKTARETIASSDGARPRFAFGAFETESIAVSEVFDRRVSFWRAFSEAIAAADKVGKLSSVMKRERLAAIGGRVRKGAGKNQHESLAAAELFGRAVVFNRTYSESLRAREAMRKAMSIREFEAIAVAEEMVKGASGVIDNLVVFDDAMTFEAFVNMLEHDSPLEYSAFKRLIPGDYEYQSAIVKVTASSELGELAVISDLNLQIDVPDVNDRGRVSCSTSSPAVVNFARVFTVPPEVSLTAVGGATGRVLIPRVIGAITLTGFTVGLFNTDGTLADGIVSWSADGY